MAQGVKTGGRQKGTPNRTTALLKDAIILAAEQAGDDIDGGGLVSYLKAQTTSNPSAYMSLLGKVLPMQITGANGGAVQVQQIITGVPRDGE
jgi:hypothetical protein